LVALATPNFTIAPVRKPVPVIVTVLPPNVEPLFGEIDVNVGNATEPYVYALRPVAAPVSAFVIRTFTAPVLPAGVVAVIDVAELTTTLVAKTPSIFTVAPLTKPVPVIVTEVPPVVNPVLGEIEVTVGAEIDA
jgi:hypothetical protein